MTYKEAIRSAGRAYLYRILSESRGNVTDAAKIAGVNRVTMYALLERHGVAVETRRHVKQVEPEPQRRTREEVGQSISDMVAHLRK